MKYSMYCALVCIFITQNCLCMDTLQRNIITSDGINDTFPQWKIESSRVLHTKQLWQAFKEKYKGAQPAPLLLKTIPSRKLKLFSEALETKNFPQYFKELSYETQQDLIRVASENELDSPIVTINLIEYYFSKDFLQANIIPLIPLFHVADDICKSIIFDHCKNKNFKEIPCQEEMVIHCQSNGDCSRIPLALTYDENYVTYLQVIHNTINGESYVIDKIKPINQDQCYRLTYHKSTDNLYYINKRNLWITNGDCSQATLKRLIQHTNEIDKTAFSDDGKFLITASFPPQAELILTDLSLHGSLPDAFLSGHGDKINDVCFNEKSTLLAVGSDNGIQLWDVYKKSVVKIFDDCINQSSGHCIFGPNNLFAACTITNEGTLLKLWNIPDISSITLKCSIEMKHSIPRNLRFDLEHNSLIVMAPTHVVLIDTNSGKIIMETPPIEGDGWRVHAAVLMLNTDILVTTMASNKCIGYTKLWDTHSGTLLATLLENQKYTRGVGATARKIFSLLKNKVIETHLYDEKTKDTLDWIDHKATLLQRYLLTRLNRAHKNEEMVNLDPDSPEYTILQSLSIQPHVKSTIEKYLLSKK